MIYGECITTFKENLPNLEWSKSSERKKINVHWIKKKKKKKKKKKEKKKKKKKKKKTLKKKKKKK